MKKQAIFISIMLTLLFGVVNLQAQQLDKEVKVDISRKAARGKLAEISVNNEKKQLELLFVTKSTKRKVKMENYIFDYDLNLIKEDAIEEDIEKVKRGKMKRFKGENYSIVGLEAKADFFGNAVFKRKQISYSWNWFFMNYLKTTKTLEKLKPKTDDGSKMYFYDAYELDSKGEVLALVGEKDKRNPASQYKNLNVLRVNRELDIVNKAELKFPSTQYPVYKGNLSPSEDENGDYVLIFAPSEVAGSKSEAGKTPNEYTLIRVDTNGNVVQKTSFLVKGNFWKILGVYQMGDNLIVYGPCKTKNVDKDFYDVFKDPLAIAQEDKFSHFQLVSFNSKGLNYVTCTSTEEFEKKTKAPSNQKKVAAYDGKRVVFGYAETLPNGELIIFAQDYKQDIRTKQIQYDDIYAFHYAVNGDLKASYSIDPESKKGGLIGGSIGDARQYVSQASIVPKSGEEAILILKTPRIVQEEVNYDEYSKTTVYWPRYTIKGVKINLKEATISEVKTFGDNEYYLYDEYKDSYATILEGGIPKIVFICEAKKEKKLWLGKFDPEKF